MGDMDKYFQTVESLDEERPVEEKAVEEKTIEEKAIEEHPIERMTYQDVRVEERAYRENTYISGTEERKPEKKSYAIVFGVIAILCIVLVLVLYGMRNRDNNPMETQNNIVSKAEKENTTKATKEPDTQKSTEETSTVVETTEDNARRLDFSTTDIDNNSVSLSDFQEAKVIMLNFWEPWCGPCVREMGDLEKLYEAYKDSGFVLIGAFTTQGQDADVRSVMSNCGTTYPILRASESMYEFMTEYVPTTIFLDGSGRILVEEPVIGAKKYSDWESIITKLLNEGK